MTITLARIHYDAGQALGVWDFRTPAAVKPYKTSRANMRITVIARITIREAHVPPLEGLHLFLLCKKKQKLLPLFIHLFFYGGVAPILVWRSCT